MNYSKKHLKISQFKPISKNTTRENKQLGKWYEQIENTNDKKTETRIEGVVYSKY